MGALDGIKVLDFTHYIAGPHCSQILADHGAEVIKIEPLTGEPSRYANPMHKGSSIYFQAMNRNKRTLALDLKSKEGKKVIRKLIQTSDVLVTNYSVGVPERLGIGYEEVSKLNDKMIMTHITGFGLTGPMKDYGAFDGIIQAMSGVAHLTGEKDGQPLKTGLFIADHIAAFQGAIGVLLGLASRSRTGKGQLVDVGMYDSLVSMLAYNLSLASVFDKVPNRAGNRSTNVFATTFKSKDGYLYIAPLTENMWIDFCSVIGKPEYAEIYSTTNSRLKDYDYLESEVNKWTGARTTNEIIDLLRERKIACGKVNSINDLLEDEQLKERNMLLSLELEGDEIIVPGVVIKLSDDKDRKENPAPPIGYNTEEILKELGYSSIEIKDILKVAQH
ncbi:CaiB/BaiF CoA transferase family protein [Sporosarcina obsidiansis]|uniref:CaiB/BaiF CoA transferase family protein n=1 Tax=Sporosarcina obsidiansis TaxID=2660748 RepID=UPI00129BC5B0|nr:CoA transferase [Sporosarcina obsidiansis]